MEDAFAIPLRLAVIVDESEGEVSSQTPRRRPRGKRKPLTIRWHMDASFVPVETYRMRLVEGFQGGEQRIFYRCYIVGDAKLKRMAGQFWAQVVPGSAAVKRLRSGDHCIEAQVIPLVMTESVDGNVLHVDPRWA